MSAFAAVKLTVDLGRRRGAAIFARDAVDGFAGTRNVTLDASSGVLAFELLFPGNLSALVRLLDSQLIPALPTAEVAIPVRALTGEAQMRDPEETARRIAGGAPVWDAEFRRGRYVLAARLVDGRVEATIVAGNAGMHELYDAMLAAGFMAAGLPTSVELASGA